MLGSTPVRSVVNPDETQVFTSRNRKCTAEKILVDKKKTIAQLYFLTFPYVFVSGEC